MSFGDALGGIFGSDKASSAASSFVPAGFSGGGISAKFNGNRFSVKSNKERKGLFQSLSDTLNERSGEIGNLLPLVSPGFGNITKSRVQAVKDAARRSVGNLSDTLSRRRVFGSSFGQDAIARAEAEFGKKEAEVRARSFLEELDLTTQLIEKKFNAAQGAVQAIIDNLNIEANIGTQLASNATAALQQNAALQAQVAQNNSDAGLEGLGAIIGFAGGFL